MYHAHKRAFATLSIHTQKLLCIRTGVSTDEPACRGRRAVAQNAESALAEVCTCTHRTHCTFLLRAQHIFLTAFSFRTVPMDPFSAGACWRIQPCHKPSGNLPAVPVPERVRHFFLAMFQPAWSSFHSMQEVLSRAHAMGPSTMRASYEHTPFHFFYVPPAFTRTKVNTAMLCVAA